MIIAHDLGTSVASELLARDLKRSLRVSDARWTIIPPLRISTPPIAKLAQTVLRSPIGPLLARYSTRRVFVSQFQR